MKEEEEQGQGRGEGGVKRLTVSMIRLATAISSSPVFFS